MNGSVGIAGNRTTGNVLRGDRAHPGLASRRNTNAPGTRPVLRVQQAPTRHGPGEPGEVGQIIMPRTGLQLARQLPFDSWLRIGRQLSAVSNASSWCLGDWLAYGETAYSGRYRDAVEQTSLDYQTLRNYAWVAKSFPLSRRRDSLSFGHHAEVAALPEHEQDFWLRKAQELGWSRNRLRRELRASLREQKADCPSSAGEPGDGELPGGAPDAVGAAPASGEPADPDTDSAHRLELDLTPEQLALCREAASREGLRVADWALQVLSHAASNTVQTEGTP